MFVSCALTSLMAVGPHETRMCQAHPTLTILLCKILPVYILRVVHRWLCQFIEPVTFARCAPRAASHMHVIIRTYVGAYNYWGAKKEKRLSLYYYNNYYFVHETNTVNPLSGPYFSDLHWKLTRMYNIH